MSVPCLLPKCSPETKENLAAEIGLEPTPFLKQYTKLIFFILDFLPLAGGNNPAQQHMSDTIAWEKLEAYT